MAAVGVGGWALGAAVVAGVVAAVAPAGRRHRSVGTMALAVAAGGLLVAVAVLVEAFWSNDFSLAYVADHARRRADGAIRLAGLWGGMGGSLLLYALGTAIVAVLAAWRAPTPSQALVVQVGGALTAALGGFVAILADPFARLAIPATDGAGLTPILEHPAMLYHPPLVYAGLTSLTAPFALTMAALVRGRLDDDWRVRVRRWLLVPWALLAIGMLAGAHWAYVELGWGGYWAWDPVENTALLPWLAVTAALHGLQPVARSSRRATPDLAVAGMVSTAFLLALFGGLLTRSGATGSVHAFAEAHSVGRAFSALVAVASAGVVILVLRFRNPTGRTSVRRARSREPLPARGLALRAQQCLVLAALMVVLAGSVWPLATELAGGREVAVQGTYFAAFCGPLAVAVLVLMAVGPSLGRSSSAAVALAPAVGAAIGVTLAAFGGWTGWFPVTTAAAGGAAMGGVVLAATHRVGGAHSIASHVAHLGVAVLLIGVAGTSTGGTETVALAEGATTRVLGRSVGNDGVTVIDDQDSTTSAVGATVTVDGRTYRPQLVAHMRRNRLLAESALHSRWHEDVQVMLRDAQDDGSVVVQVGVHPLQQLVWWGALLVVLGGATALAGERLSRRGRRRARDAGAGIRGGTRASPRPRPRAPAPPVGAGGASTR